MAENAEHPKKLWLVEEDVDEGFTVREADVTPVHPEKPPGDWTRYHVAGCSEWYTVALDVDAFRTRVEALERAVENAYDAALEWKHKTHDLEKLLSSAQDEAAAEEEDEETE